MSKGYMCFIVERYGADVIKLVYTTTMPILLKDLISREVPIVSDPNVSY